MTDSSKDLTAAEADFLKQTAFPLLDSTTSSEALKHFADVMWNLATWEKQRADIVDTKAQALVALAGVVSAVAAANGQSLLSGKLPWIGVVAIGLFLLSALVAIVSLKVRDYPGFHDADIFGALSAHTKPLGTSPFVDKDQFNCYLRELAMQRWLIYSGFKETTQSRVGFLAVAQWVAICAIAFFVISVVLKLTLG